MATGLWLLEALNYLRIHIGEGSVNAMEYGYFTCGSKSQFTYHFINKQKNVFPAVTDHFGKWSNKNYLGSVAYKIVYCR